LAIVRRAVAALALMMTWSLGMGAAARPVEPPSAGEFQAGSSSAAAPTTTCDLIETAAAEHGLPVGYFTRLIWRESSFRPEVVSPVGAQGIAQFMPGTAAERGLADPFDPLQAIPASAQLLRALAERFGNLGLAAAAYNAGPRRVADWLAGTTSGLPRETRNYVAVITGRTVEDWQGMIPDSPVEPAGPTADTGANAEAGQNCLEVLAALNAPAPSAVAPRTPQDDVEWQPWGVQVAGNFSQERAMASYRSLQERYPMLADRDPLIVRQRNLSFGPRPMVHVRIPAPTREAANDLCRQLRDDGAACVVLKN
jgi:hypothetical protein